MSFSQLITGNIVLLFIFIGIYSKFNRKNSFVYCVDVINYINLGLFKIYNVNINEINNVNIGNLNKKFIIIPNIFINTSYKKINILVKEDSNINFLTNNLSFYLYRPVIYNKILSIIIIIFSLILVFLLIYQNLIL